MLKEKEETILEIQHIKLSIVNFFNTVFSFIRCHWIISALIVTIFYLSHLITSPVIKGVIICAMCGLFFAIGVLIALLNTGTSHNSEVLMKSRTPKNETSLPELLSKRRLYPDFTKADKKILLSRQFDAYLQVFVDAIIDKYMLPIYDKIAQDKLEFRYIVRNLVWAAGEKLSPRLSKIDYVILFTRDVLMQFTRHLQFTRSIKSKNSAVRAKCSYHYCLKSQESEMRFLRQITETFLCICLDQKESRCSPVRLLLRELIVTKVLYPTVKLLTDPDVINQTLIKHLQSQENLRKTQDVSYAYARTYEEFIKIINKCKNPIDLKRIRYYTIQEVMQATAIRNMKYARETEQDKVAMTMLASKGQRLSSRNLHKYINQLKCAKVLCEKRLRNMGEDILWNSTPIYEREIPHNPNINLTQLTHPNGIQDILDNNELRAVYLLFLESRDEASLCHFWLALEEIETQELFSFDQVIKTLFDTFLDPESSSYVNLHLSKVELFRNFSVSLDPHILFEFRSYIVYELKERNFTEFLESKEFREYLEQNSKNNLLFKFPPETNIPKNTKTPLFRSKSSTIAITTTPTTPTTPTTTNNSNSSNSSSNNTTINNNNEPENEVMEGKLLTLREKRDTITRQLKQRSATIGYEQKASLEQAWSKTDTEILQIEHYINRTSDWFLQLGKWKIEISSLELEFPNKDDPNPLFTFLVSPTVTTLPKNVTESSEQTLGWVIARRFSDVSELHEILIELSPDIKKYFPNTSMKYFSKRSKEYWDRVKINLKTYFSYLMQNQVILESEALYRFFSPAAEHLKQSYPTDERSTKTKIADVLMKPFIDDSRENDDKDQIAEYFYDLIREIFELDGTLTNWIRRQLISIAQATFGSSIGRQLRLTSVWLVSEPMLTFYLTSLQEKIIMDPETTQENINRSDEEKAKSKEDAYRLLLNSIPEIMQDLVGTENAKNGITKLFRSIQDPQQNKHLLYKLLELFIFTLIPELHQSL